MTRAVFLALVFVAGCASSRVTFEPRSGRAIASAEDVAAGDALYPFQAADGRWGYMDATGRVAVGPRFDAAEPFSEGRAAVRVDGAYGYADPSGRLAVPARYALAAPFSEGRALVAEGDGPRYGFVDAAGAVVVPAVLPAAYSYSDGRALVRLRERDLTQAERFVGVDPVQAFLDLDGRVAFAVPGEAASFSEGLAPFSAPTLFSGGGWGYLRPDGSVAIPADLGGTAYRFSEGLARVGRDGRVGFIGTDGEPAFAQTYALALPFSEGLAAVRVDGLWGYVDAAGRVVVPPRFSQAGPFSGGLAAVEAGGRWGYIGPDGAFAIGPAFRSAQPFRGPLAYVEDEAGAYYIDPTGRPVRPEL